MPVTREQADMLTTLAIAMRPTGARQWDPQGVLAAIRKVAHLALPDVTKAVARAADDRHLDTPGAIGNPTAPCWRERVTDRPAPRPEPVKPGRRCSICSLEHDRCRAQWAHDHDFDPDFRPAGPAVDVDATVSGLMDLVAHAKHAVLPTPDHQPTPDPNVERLSHLAHPTDQDQREDHPA